MKTTLTFHHAAKQFVLNVFGKKVDDEGYIVEKDDPAQKVLTSQGEEIELMEFAGVRKGSEIFIKSDIASLIAASDYIKS